MLSALKKAVGIEAESKLEGNTTEVFDSEALMAQLSEANEMLAANDVVMTTLNEQLTNMASEIEGYKEKLQSLQHFADEAEAKALAAAEEMKAKELADKKQMLADVIGGDNPGFDVTFAAIANLEGEAFNVVVNGFKAAFEKEAESPFFKEMGVSGEAEPVEDKEESATARIIKQQYNK